MINILFFIETLKAGGAEKVLCDLVNHMNQNEFQITVRTIWPSEADNLLTPGIHYRSVFKKKNAWNSFIYRLSAQLKLTYLLYLKSDYDIECAYLEMGPTKVISASTNPKSVKLAWVHCDLQKKLRDISGFVKKAQSQYSKFNEIVCVSENVKDSFIELFGNEPPVRVIYNVVDDRKIKELAQEPLPKQLHKEQLIVVTLGRLTHQKGYDILLKVHKQLIDEGILHDLWIAGEGEERENLESYIIENHLEQSVHLTGYINNPYPLLAQADVLVCSSRYEGFSTFVTEGLILGKPIVTTDCTGMKELLGDSEYGMIADMDEQSLKDQLKRMLKDEVLRNEYAVKAAKRGESFKMENLVNQTEEYFRKLVSSNK